MRLPTATFPSLDYTTPRITEAVDVRLPNLVNVVTTTIFPNGTAVATSTAKKRPLSDKDIGGILGGVMAGIFLVIAVVIGWHCWGHSIARQKRKQRKAEEAMRKVRNNTLQNTGPALTSPRSSSYKPIFSNHSEGKVKFASAPPEAARSESGSSAAEKGRARTASTGSTSSGKLKGKHSRTRSDSSKISPATPEIPAPSPARINGARIEQPAPSAEKLSPPSSARPSKPRPLRSSRLARNNKGGAEAGPSQLRPSRQRSQNRVAQGTEDKHTSLVMAALSNRWSILTRSSASTERRQKPSRLSQASSGSAYSQPSNQMGVPIGLAYGGE